MASFAESELLIAMIEAFGAPRPSSFGLGELQNDLVAAITSGSSPGQLTIPFVPPGTYPALQFGPGVGWTSSKNSSTAPITKGIWNLAVPDNPTTVVEGLYIKDTDTPTLTLRQLFQVDDHTGAPIFWVTNAGGGINATDSVRVLNGSLAVIAQLVGPEYPAAGQLQVASLSAATPGLSFKTDNTSGWYLSATGPSVVSLAIGGGDTLNFAALQCSPNGDNTYTLGGTLKRFNNVYSFNFLTPTGSAGAPSYTFQDDTTTGVYLPSAGNLGISVGGVAVATATASQLTLGGTGVSVNFGFATTALGGGAAPTLGTIGGSGPATAAQNSWLKIAVNGTTAFIPLWH